VKINTREVDQITVATLDGELDGRAAPEVQDRLTRLVDTSHRLLIDMTGVSYMSSAGLRTMLLLYRQAQCTDCLVALLGLSEDLRSLMAATGFLDFFTIVDSVNRGIEALRS
jgi:anti-sigma B factor antagonist